MRHKSLTIAAKAPNAEGLFQGLIEANPPDGDHSGERIASFANLPVQVPIEYLHNEGRTIGTATVTPRGDGRLLVLGRLDMSDATARGVHKRMQRDPEDSTSLTELSVGFRFDSRKCTKDANGVVAINDARLVHVSPVHRGAQVSELMSVKSRVKRPTVLPVSPDASVVTSTASALESAGWRAQGAGLYDVETALAQAARELRAATSGGVDLSAVQAVVAALDDANCVSELTRVGLEVTASNVARAINDLEVLASGGKTVIRKYKWTSYTEDVRAKRMTGARKLLDAIPGLVARTGLPRGLATFLQVFLAGRISTGHVEPRSLRRGILKQADQYVMQYNVVAERARVKELARRSPVLLGPAPLVDAQMRPIVGAAAIPTDADEQSFRLPLVELGEDTWRVEQG